MIIRQVRSKQELEEVYKILYTAFFESGYIKANRDKKLVRYPKYLNKPDSIVFVAIDSDGKIVGTCSTTLDSDIGLPIEEHYPKEFNEARAKGKKLCVTWALATSKKYKRDHSLVYALLQAQVCTYMKYDVDICFAQINPKHSSIHRKILGARVVETEVKDYVEGLENAPAVLIEILTSRVPAMFRERTHEVNEKYSILV